MKFLKVTDNKQGVRFIKLDIIESVYFNKDNKSIRILDKDECWYALHEGDPNFEYIKNIFFADETSNIVTL